MVRGVKTLGAHQVNLCPYMGIIEKAAACDIFVLMGHVQFEYSNYQNRFRADGNWHTMSVVRENGFEMIRAKNYVSAEKDWDRIKKSYPQLQMFDTHVCQSLWTMNSGIFTQTIRHFELKCELVNDYETHLKGTDRLIDLCKTFGAERYLSGPSGKKYLDEKAFEMAGIELAFHEIEDTRPLVDCI